MERPRYVQRSRDGDYVMRFTGLTWSVLRRTGEEGAFILSTGHREPKDGSVAGAIADRTRPVRRVGACWCRLVPASHSLQEKLTGFRH